MSKKKKFAGKKTKLAEHALTQVLEHERTEAPEPPDVPASSLTLAQAVQALRNDQLRLELSQEEDQSLPSQRHMETDNTYLALLQELEDMRELLRAPNLPPRSVTKKPEILPKAEIIEYSLKVIDNTLRDLKALMG